jgi:branched-chain amino acid transport system substrate-binding protein
LQTLSAAEVASRYGYAFVNGMGTYEAFFAARLSNAFSVSYPSDNSLTDFAQFLLSLPRSMRPKTAAYVTADDPLALPQVERVRRMLEQGGILTVSHLAYPYETTDFTTYTQQVIASRASVVILGTSSIQDTTSFIQAFKQQHYNPQALIATTGANQGSAFTQAIGLVSTEGVFAPNGGWYPGIPTYQNAQFVRDYITKYGGTPEGISSDTVQAFSTGQILEQAIRKIQSINNAALIQELHTDTFNSLQGLVKFDKTGRNILAVSHLFQWQKGHLIPVYPSTIAQTRPEFPKAEWP